VPVQGRLGYPRSPASRSNTYGDDNLCSAAMISSSLVRVGTLQGPPHCAGDFDLSRKACVGAWRHSRASETSSS
jgi:hypothetical protein